MDAKFCQKLQKKPFRNRQKIAQVYTMPVRHIHTDFEIFLAHIFSGKIYFFYFLTHVNFMMLSHVLNNHKFENSYHFEKNAHVLYAWTIVHTPYWSKSSVFIWCVIGLQATWRVVFENDNFNIDCLDDFVAMRYQFNLENNVIFSYKIAFIPRRKKRLINLINS